jgi:hypothetical protein
MYTCIARFLMNCVEAVRRAPCIFCPSECLLLRGVSECIFYRCKLFLVGRSCFNLVVESRDEILLRGVGCDAPGFQPGSLTLMSRSTVLTLVKRWSTLAITSKTSPPTSNDSLWSTSSQGLVKPLAKPLEPRLTH